MKGVIMLQGTASSVGKSLLCAALCRIFKQDGFKVAPFKSQNMALNSYVTKDGCEMGRAQVMQAEAAGVEPKVTMNPVLLKPTSDQGSQVIVMGRPVGNMEAMAYYSWKSELLPVIDQAYQNLADENDLIVIEGAGSPAEINLKDNDLVNMGLASRLKAPVLLVGDIDRGGVFASLYGTAQLLETQERALLKGVVINKFRGDVRVLEPGLEQLADLLNLPVIGVVPMLKFNLDDEDSVTDRFKNYSCGESLKIQVILLPRISNFTDFNPLELYDDLNLSYISEPCELKSPDLLIIPGSKNTLADLVFLREMGWESALKDYVASGGLLAGICGGFQMLGMKINDPDQVEGKLQEVPGFGMLNLETTMQADKLTRQVKATWHYRDDRYFSFMQEELLTGYEIHMGQTVNNQKVTPLLSLENGETGGAVNVKGNIFGTYLHGLFDNLAWTTKLLNGIRKVRGLPLKYPDLPASYRDHKEKEYDRLAEQVRKHLDMNQIYRIIESGV